MATEAQILAVLTGRKVFDGRQWRVFDATTGIELADAGGVLWRGVHGALLWNANRTVEPAGGGSTYFARAERIHRQNQALIAALTAFAAAGAIQ